MTDTANKLPVVATSHVCTNGCPDCMCQDKLKTDGREAASPEVLGVANTTPPDSEDKPYF